MAQWLTMALKNVADWPASEFVQHYDGYEFLLLPETERTPPAIAVELKAGLDSRGAIAAIRRFLSALTWATGHHIQDHFAIGARRPGGVGKDPGPPLTPKLWFRLDYLPSTQDPKARLSLALYREALGLNNEAYRVLAFFKIINVLHESGPAQKKWINGALPKLTDHHAVERLKELGKTQSDAGKYFFESGRCAVAHAYSQPLVDPDNPSDTQRLNADLPVIRALAVHLIEHELGIKTADTVRREHLYQLAGFRELLGVDLVARLKKRERVAAADLPPFPAADIAVREHLPYITLRALKPSIVALDDGIITADYTTPCGLFTVRFGLDFPNERLGVDVLNGMGVSDDGTAGASLVAQDYNRLFADLFRNGVLELVHTQTQEVMGRTDPFVPVNMRYNHEAFEARRSSLQIEQLQRISAPLP